MKGSQTISEINEGPLASQWEKIGIKDHHGIIVPLFSLHSETSAGIGEYPDLLSLIPWMQSVGLDVLQLLPLNDTGPNHSPYSAISSFALNPLYLGLASLPYINESRKLKSSLKELQSLSKTKRVNYKTLQPMRDQFLREYFEESGYKTLETLDYEKFLKENPWLKGYALFKAIKTHTHWQKWSCWPQTLNDLIGSSLEEVCEKFESDIAYYIFVQYLCFQQMDEVKKCADKNGVFLKGDLPILLDRESADVWLHRELFDLNFSAGAPPDAYAEEGQNWGFPLYHWGKMEEDGYAWWKERLRVASNFYHLYRIDHIVCFFRIWAIPKGEETINGSFHPNDPREALEQGKKNLRMMISATGMLPIGEDLGTVPPEVRKELKRLGICGTRVMRWERNWDGDRQFIVPQNYDPISVTTLSTHDSSTFTVWWGENTEEAYEYAHSRGWEYSIPLSSKYLFASLYLSHHTGSLFHINLLQEYLALLPDLVSENPHNERINIPGTISEFNWSYRFHPSVEEIVADSRLRQIFNDLMA